MTTEGIVTLSGSVGNILARERAARVAMIVKGFRAVVNEIEVSPSILRTDQDIEDALLTDPAIDSYEIEVKVENNMVTLTGTVDSLQEKVLTKQVKCSR